MNRHEIEVLGQCILDLILEAGATEAEAVHLLVKLLASCCFEARVPRERLLYVTGQTYDNLQLLNDLADAGEIH